MTTDPEPMDDRRAVEIVCAIARSLPGWGEDEE